MLLLFRNAENLVCYRRSNMRIKHANKSENTPALAIAGWRSALTRIRIPDRDAVCTIPIVKTCGMHDHFHPRLIFHANSIYN